MFRFRKLVVYDLARKLVKFIYEITATFPDKEKFVLVSQINRAAISVVSNIAEGSSRSSSKDRAYFINISYCSLMEVVCQIDVAMDLGYVDEATGNALNEKAQDLAIRLTNFQNHIKNNPQ